MEDSSWDLSAYAGIKLSIEKADGAWLSTSNQGRTNHRLTCRAEKRYTLILKDELLPANPDNGREQASISYEADFELSTGGKEERFVFVPWASLNATYRGKVCLNVLDTYCEADPTELVAEEGRATSRHEACQAHQYHDAEVSTRLARPVVIC